MLSVTCNPSPLSKSDMALLNLILELLSRHHLLGLDSARATAKYLGVGRCCNIHSAVKEALWLIA